MPTFCNKLYFGTHIGTVSTTTQKIFKKTHCAALSASFLSLNQSSTNVNGRVWAQTVFVDMFRLAEKYLIKLDVSLHAIGYNLPLCVTVYTYTVACMARENLYL
jgi:hypothetical protein